jgi:(p)ppGpp synthase/HD superfamily hydrolase
MIEHVTKAKAYAEKAHDDAGCTYGDNDESYVVHLDEVRNWVLRHPSVLRFTFDFENVLAAAYTHDLIEDAQQTYNDVKDATSKEVADITLAVTDVHAENRMLRFLLTVPKMIKDYRALVLKVCDIAANASYGRSAKNSMYRKYQKEWAGYKRYIFVTASRQYEKELRLGSFNQLISSVDEIMGYED